MSKVVWEMTPERRERCERLAGELLDLLISQTESHYEAYIILDATLTGLAKQCGFRLVRRFGEELGGTKPI